MRETNLHAEVWNSANERSSRLHIHICWPTLCLLHFARRADLVRLRRPAQRQGVGQLEEDVDRVVDASEHVAAWAGGEDRHVLHRRRSRRRQITANAP
jgi:hypothetical protein